MAHSRATLHTLDGEPFAEVALTPWESVYDSLSRSAYPLRSTCHGSTICGLCRVTLLDPPDTLPPVLPDEAELLGEGAGPNERLACRLRVARGQHLKLSTAYW